MNWYIRVPRENPYAISFNSFDNHVGETQNGHIGSLPLTVEVIHANSSSIISIVTLTIAEHFNGTNIMCNGDRIMLTFNGVSKLYKQCGY